MNTPPFLLVRVQDDLHGAHITERGLRLRYDRNSEFAEYRNTLHWSVNCAVADHPYGRFNESTDGRLIGKVAIIADPRELPVPAGLGEVDTWYRMDASPRFDGSLERGLDVGKNATIIAPLGTPVPEGANVVHYDGGIAERNAAINRVLRDAGIEPRIAGMWSWQNSEGIGRWAADTAEKIYGAQADGIHIGPHSSSVDDAIEAGARLAAMVERFEAERLYTLADGTEVPMYDVISTRIQGQRDALNVLIGGLTPHEKGRSGAYYESRLASLLLLEEKASSINEDWRRRLEEVAEPIPRAPVPLALPPLPLTPPSLSMSPPLPTSLGAPTSPNQVGNGMAQGRLDVESVRMRESMAAYESHAAAVPDPIEAIAAFRAGRMASGVEAISPAASGFAAEVDIALAGTRSAQDSIKALTKAFIASYRALWEAQESSRANGVINQETTDALKGVMRQIRDGFGAGLEAMRANTDRLEAHSPGDYAAFCRTAHDKINRLEIFWKDASKNAPAHRM